jgi:hypothetical protein
VIGMPAPPGPRQDKRIRAGPRSARDGGRSELGGTNVARDPHAGHASNHLCYLDVATAFCSPATT